MSDAGKRSRRQAGWGRKIFGLYVAAYLGYLLLPLVILVLYAFNSSEYLIWPIKGFTLRW